MATVKIARTSAGLKDALFEAIEALRAGDIEPKEAQMIAGLAGQIVSVTRLELDVFNYARSNGLEEAEASPVPIEMGVNRERPPLPPVRRDAPRNDDEDRSEVQPSPGTPIEAGGEE